MTNGVSVIMPVLNEQVHLDATVGAIQAQDWPGSLQIVIALGPSNDKTDVIARELASLDERITLVSNPSGHTPDGLNAALGAAEHDVIVRVDGHCELPTNYVSLAVETLERTGADNVGGIMAASGQTSFEKAAACAMTSRIGVGGAAFHTGGQEGPASTVYLGSFKAETLAKVGGYDPTFLRAQDWELNHRIITSGGSVWFNPAMTVKYRPRPSISSLAKQYFNYGRWRREMMRTYGDTVSLRYLAPPLLVACVTLCLVAALAVGVVSRMPWLAAVCLVPVLLYVLITVIGGVAISSGHSLKTRLLTPLALMAMHVAWGVGFICSPQNLRAQSDLKDSHGDVVSD